MKQEIYVIKNPLETILIFKLSVLSFQDLLDPTSFCVHSCDDNLLIDCVIIVLFIVLHFDMRFLISKLIKPRKKFSISFLTSQSLSERPISKSFLEPSTLSVRIDVIGTYSSFS